MRDLINRQAAIDAFMTATCDGDKAEWCTWVIKHVPSETLDIIRCKDCKFRTQATNGYYCGYEFERCDSYEMTRNASDPNYFCADAEMRKPE